MEHVDKDGVVHDQPEHLTRKSHHSLERDRLKHSGKIGALQHGPRKGGYGKGNVGVAGAEDDEELQLDPRDPDYEGEEEEEEEEAQKQQQEAQSASSSSAAASQPEQPKTAEP
jgi:hypothetical protein